MTCSTPSANVTAGRSCLLFIGHRYFFHNKSESAIAKASWSICLLQVLKRAERKKKMQLCLIGRYLEKKTTSSLKKREKTSLNRRKSTNRLHHVRRKHIVDWRHGRQKYLRQVVKVIRWAFLFFFFWHYKNHKGFTDGLLDNKKEQRIYLDRQVFTTHSSHQMFSC